MVLHWTTIHRISAILFIAIALNGKTLKEAAAARGLVVGTAVESRYLTDPSYAAILAGQYSQVEPENEMKWRIIHPQAAVYSFGAGDAIVSFAALHGMKVRGHTLTGDTQLPSWVCDLALGPNQLRGILQDHITTVMKHYAGRV